MTKVISIEKKHIGVVLAGGRSQRMGRDKALLDFRGRPLLAHMLDLLVQAGMDECVVSGHYPGYRCVPDAIAHAGPVGALHTLSRIFADTRLFIVPVDMPLLPLSWLTRLFESEREATCVHYQQSPLPMRLDTNPATRACIDTLFSEAALNTPRGPSLWRLSERLSASVLPWPRPDPLALSNINTLKDWEQLSR